MNEKKIDVKIYGSDVMVAAKPEEYKCLQMRDNIMTEIAKAIPDISYYGCRLTH